MIRMLPAPLLKGLSFVLPLGAILLARLLTYSSWAAQNSGMAAALYSWIVADVLLLALIAKAPDHKPALFQVVGAVSLASIIILFGASAPLQEVYLGLPQVLLAAGGTVVVFISWSAFRVFLAWRDTGSLAAGFESVLPSQLVRSVISECKVLWLGVFRWGAPVDAPADSRAFAYHTYLTPMIATFVVLQLIELSVVHLLLMLWNPLVAWIMLALSVWGVIWTVALLKSFRIKPVFMTTDAVRIRSGMIYDFNVPISNIADFHTGFTSDELAQKGVLNLAIMSSPNVSLRFVEPITIQTFFGTKQEISGVGLRLDESAEFVAELARKP